ncbi:hypothetical protein MVES1_000119 [Malassezia vespertilionis]|uniref:uncharacterized protein n=1 Tax=Malassezia vespertilionis TaxID=2020962 RepID=UPI0024B1A190|nr:uncharacterized protein MVES1_000119 [Malassezia vespertilionis]WFD04795.1 hypothetical protein MVES1_000119 [Malassezia vespertilionis]
MPAANASVCLRNFSSSVCLFTDNVSAPQSDAEKAKKMKKDESSDDGDQSRAALWNQMLNTIIVEPVGRAPADTKRNSHDGFANAMDMWNGGVLLERKGAEIPNTMIKQLDQEFRGRPTLGMSSPATPTTGRSISAANTYGNNSASMLYRNLMSTLRRNNIRRELKLGERYEKPNQMRRRKRSERHRRRFADMIRKKVQLYAGYRTEDEVYLPEDSTPAMWQRIAQLVAGTLAAGTMAYFALFADFGVQDHCFIPLREALNIHPNTLRDLLAPPEPKAQ